MTAWLHCSTLAIRSNFIFSIFYALKLKDYGE